MSCCCCCSCCVKLLATLTVLVVAIGLHVGNVGVQADNSAVNESDAAGRNLTNLYKRNLLQMMRIINGTADACYDFYAHACGNFERSSVSAADETAAYEYAYAYDEDMTAANVDEDAVPPFLYNKEDRMHFFDEQHRHFGTRPGRILAQLYVECKTRNEQHVLSTRPPLSHWARMLQQLDFLAPQAALYAGWPYLRYQWTRLQRRHDLHWVPLAAQFAARGLPSLLDIYFAEQTIFIAPPTQLLCPSLGEFKLSLAPVLQARNAQIAHIIGHELRSFCRSLRGELPPSGDVRASALNGTTADSSNVLIDENTVEYFQHYFALLNFTGTELAAARKLPMDIERLAVILHALRRTEPRIIFNYVLWHAHESLKYEDCYLLTEEFERLLHAEYWHWHVFQPHFRREVAMAMYLYHTTRFQQQRKALLMGKDWYKFLLAPLERKDFNIERIIQAHANSYLNVHQLAETYANLSLTPAAFYGNLLQLRRTQLRASFFTPLIDNEDLNHPAYFLRQFLDFCILNLKQPMFHYYATQGFELWHASNLLYDTDGYYTALDCLERQSLLHIEDAPHIFRVLDTHAVAETFRFYRAFAEAHSDYRFWLEGESFAFAEDFVLQYFSLDTRRVLFYAVAQTYCNRNDHLYAAQINRSFMNMQTFQSAFNCSADSPMNPAAKCMISQCD